MPPLLHSKLRSLRALLALVASILALLGGNAKASVSFYLDDKGLANLFDVSTYLGAQYFYDNETYGQGVKIANIEGGLADATNAMFANTTWGETLYPTDADPTVLTESHPTLVSSIMCGSNTSYEEGTFEFYQARGIAYQAELSTCSIAYGYNEDGTYKINDSDICKFYKHYFSSSEYAADVINSSWGASNPTAGEYTAYYFDALASANRLSTLVISAGNIEEGVVVRENTVASTALGFNRLAVGAIDSDMDSIADYSCRSPSDFYNPITKETITGVRTAVDICTVGYLVTAIYPDEGKIGVSAGTSFSAPTVSGVVALLKSTSIQLEARPDWVSGGWSENARDTRVIKAILLNSAYKPTNWTNNQSVQNGVEIKRQVGEGVYMSSSYDNVIVTTQGLDYTYGAGILNAAQALAQYIGMYTTGTNTNVWDFNELSINSQMWYNLGELKADTTLTATLTWFAHDAISETEFIDVDVPDLAEFALANLSLEIWMVDNGVLVPVAISDTEYNNVEHLIVKLETYAAYYLSVSFFGMSYGELSSEKYALAWNLLEIPEPAYAVLFIAIFTAIFVRAQKREK